MKISTKFNISKINVILLFIVFQFTLFAQSNTHSIVISNNTTADSTLKPLLGIISGPDQPQQSSAPNLTQRFHEIGVYSVRNNDYYDDRLDMEQIFQCPDTTTYPSWDCDPYDTSNYNWTASDAQFQSFIDGGFEPFLRLGGEWANNLRPRDFIGPQNTLQESNWIVAAIHEVERYGNWHGDTGIIKYLNLWTETSPHFWTRPYTAFYSFWSRAFDSLKTHFPQYKIGGPGFVSFDIIKEKSGLKPENFLKKLYTLGLKPDFIDWHLWQNDPEAYYKSARGYKDLLNGTGNYTYVEWAGTGYFSDVEQICGAFGISKLKQDSTGAIISLTRQEKDKLFNKKEGAAMLTGDWIALQYSDIERSYYYRSGDVFSDPNADPNDRNSNLGGPGLFFGDSVATYKPTAHAFRFWSYLFNNYPKLLSTDFPSVAADSSKLWVLGAKKDVGQYAVLISNTGDNSVPFNLNILGQPVTLSSFPLAKIYTINNSDNGLTPRQWDGNDFAILPGNVQLITLSQNITAINDNGNSAIKDFLLEQNYPNPFNPSTVIEYSIPAVESRHPLFVQLKIYDILGREVATLVNKKQNPGNYKINFNDQNLPSGIYLYRLFTNNFSKTRKMILIK